MTADQLRRWRDQRGWSVAVLTEHLNEAMQPDPPLHERTVWRWLQGESKVPAWLPAVLRMVE